MPLTQEEKDIAIAAAIKFKELGQRSLIFTALDNTGQCQASWDKSSYLCPCMAVMKHRHGIPGIKLTDSQRDQWTQIVHDLGITSFLTPIDDEIDRLKDLPVVSLEKQSYASTRTLGK